MTYQSQLKRFGKAAVKQDIYAYNPTYEWTAYKTVPGMFLSWLTILFVVFYIVLTTRDYIVRPPELISQGDIDLVQTVEEYHFSIPQLGIRLGYTSVDDPTERTAALANENPYVRIHFRHVVMQHRERVQVTELPQSPCIVNNILSTCPMVNSTYQLQGTINKHEFEFLEISIDKCTDDPICAPLDEINELLQSGLFRIRAELNLQAEQFDVERYHATGTGSVASNRSLETFNLPDVEVKSDVILKARKVQKEQRYLGSPPMPEIETNILSFDRRELSYRPRSGREMNLISYEVRIDDNIRLEEVGYWCPSILDLFGLWGAMVSFLASLSLGFIAMSYNKWSFERHFQRMAHAKRREAQMMKETSMEWIKEKNDNDISRNRREIYKNLQQQHDALMVEPDIRLFESHHFDYDGRVEMSAAELKFPSTAFGELRRLAIVEHGKRRRAALFLSLWYGRHLVKSGFIKDPARCQELFSAVEEPFPALHYRKQREKKRSFKEKVKPFELASSLRQRKRTEEQPSSSSWPTSNSRSRDIEQGNATNYRYSNGDRTSHEDDDPSSDHGSVSKSANITSGDVPHGIRDYQPTESEHEAIQVIAELDPMTETGKKS